MYKIKLPCFVIVSCFVFLASGQEHPTIQPNQTDCDKLQNCTECVESTLKCIFCTFADHKSNDTCMNSSVTCGDQGGTPIEDKKCPEIPAISTTRPTSPGDITTTTAAADTSPVTSKTESSTAAASTSSDASESSTVPPKPSIAPSGRHFDAPSFIGGTVLSLGLLAIVYVGFKFYKARTERNYHTL